MKLPHLKIPKPPGHEASATSEFLESLLTACSVVLLLASLGGLGVLAFSLHTGLRVGDILVFKPAIQVGDALAVAAVRVDAATQAPAAATCTLDPAAMARHGGSLVVESKSLVKPVYQVHWAGGQTSSDVTDCGRNADLTVSRMDLQSLVTAIGGFSLSSNGNVL
jgi:hypothetical protein